MDRMYLGVKIFLIFIVFCLTLYLLMAFTNIPGLSHARDIWIETAMTTMNHRWLAEKFFPQSVIDKVLQHRLSVSMDILGGENVSLKDVTLGKRIKSNFQVSSEDSLRNFKAMENLFPSEEYEGGYDRLDNEILVFNKEQGIKIMKIKGSGYVATLALITNPERVKLAHSSDIGITGTYVQDIVESNDAILGVNASGFVDPDGRGTGGSIVGRSISSIDNSVYGWDSYDSFASVAFTESNNLLVGKIRNPEDYQVRDLAQFGPVLIANGVVTTNGSGGWGIQPRTIIGQRADGVVAFLVVDGRQPTYSIGIEIGEAAKILSDYDVVNASACDGGASSIMSYDGSTISHPCTRNILGRKVPNAFIVLPL